MATDPAYQNDLKPATAYTPDCAFHVGTRAVVVIKIDGVQRDVCRRCWQKLRKP